MKKIIKNIRRSIYTFFALRKTKSHGIGIKVNRKCIFTNRTVIGNNCHFNGMKITGKGKVIIGNNFHSGNGCLFITSNHNYDSGNKIPYDDTYISKDIIIKDNVWIGENVTILPGVVVDEGAILQAGSVVVSNIGYCAIAGGNPAREFKKRNIKHYSELKNKNEIF